MKQTKQPSKIRTFSGQLTQVRRELRELDRTDLAGVSGGLGPDHQCTQSFDALQIPNDCDV